MTPRLRAELAQFREIGLPRCSSYEDGACGEALIWPWQDWICQIEDWPQHHACYHVQLVRMRAWVLGEEAEEPDGYHEDWYDTCRFCGWATT